MEGILAQLNKDASLPRFSALKKACKETLELLADAETVSKTEPYKLREKCLVPLRLGLETRHLRLGSYAIAGIQLLLTDERFQSSLESEDENSWLPMQVLGAISGTPNLPDDIQVEVMRVLLNMTFSTAWCMNAKVITKIAEVALDTYGANSQGSVRTAVKATLTQLLSTIAEKLKEKQGVKGEDVQSAIAEFSAQVDQGELESLKTDVVVILRYLCDKLVKSSSTSQTRQMVPLLLDGIHCILCNVPVSIRHNQEFVKIIWQSLCPSLVSLLGNPMTDKNVVSTSKTTNQDEMGRGSGCSSSAPNLTTATAKTIYNIVGELVRLVGSLRSLRPVLESVFHRMLHYPPPQHRHDALATCRQMLCNAEMLVCLAGPTLPDTESSVQTAGRRKHQQHDQALLKLILDSVQESCHCNDSNVCITSVNLISDLLNSLEQLTRGEGLSPDMIQEILKRHNEMADASFNTQLSGLVPEPPQANGDADGDDNSSSSGDSDDIHQQDVDEMEQEQTPEPEPVNTEEKAVKPKPKQKPKSALVNKHFKAGIISLDLDVVESDDEIMCDDESPMRPTVEEYKQGLLGGLLNDRGPGPLHNIEELEQKYGIRKPYYEAMERENGRAYIELLQRLLPDLLAATSQMEVDDILLQFASNVCADTLEQQGEASILNADGVYLATYAALSFNLKLIRCGYYESEEKSLPTTEQQFVDELLSTGLLVYLSPAWLAEVYQQVIKSNFLGEAGYQDNHEEELPLIQVLTDIDGMESRHVGGQLLSEFRNQVQAELATQNAGRKISTEESAGMLFARRVLAVSWEASLEVLSVLLGGKNPHGITASFSLLLGGKEEGRRAREAICTSLNSLQRAARLACSLGLQDRCGAVFQQLANASCVIEDLKREEKKGGKAPVLPGQKPKLARLHTAHALSMDLMFTIGLEMGSHSPDCWNHIFRCCVHVSELEHTYFSSGLHQASLPKVQQESAAQTYDLEMDPMDPNEPEMYSTMMMATEPVAPKINVTEVIKQSNSEENWDSAITGGGVLSPQHTAKVLCGLSQHIDRVFEDASNKLNMKALVGFISELCKSSRAQLASYPLHHTTGSSTMPNNVLHLYRLGDVLLRVLRSGRPLLHLIRIWSYVAPHLVEAACHKDLNISKKAVNCMHEFVTTLLGMYSELPHSHFNESLCKPLENLLCLGLCDGDIQDQVVCSICELVEACTSEIKSGWRPLFGALRAVKIAFTTNEEVNEARQRHVAAVLDVFDVFLNTDNVLVFANAAVDCILCLLKYVRGPGEFAEDPDDDDSDSETQGPSSEALVLPALDYLRKCCSILASMSQMPACPVFNSAYRIKTNMMPKCVDPFVQNMDLFAFHQMFDKSYHDQMTPTASIPPDHKIVNAENDGILSSSHQNDTSSGKHEDSSDQSNKSMDDKDTPADQDSLKSNDSGISVPNTSALSADDKPECDKAQEQIPNSENGTRNIPNLLREWQSVPCEDLLAGHEPVSLDTLDNHTGCLHVWFLVFEGLATTVSACLKNYQPQTLETLFDLLRESSRVPGIGPAFSQHCINHLLLPLLQTWLRQGNQSSGYWSKALVNFKQSCGLTTDLVVEFIIQFTHLEEWQQTTEMMLGQLMMVLNECMAQSNESLSRLGCACMRHLLMSVGLILSERMWHIAIQAITKSMDVTLYCLHKLMMPFDAYSDNFYGDLGSVKVGVRKDCTGIEAERLRQLAQQVFLLDSQRGTSHIIDYDVDDRSYVFLIYSPDNPDQVVSRVPFRSLVVGLLAHQLMIQTIGCLLLQGSPYMVAVEKSLLPLPTETIASFHGSEEDLMQANHPPGMMRYLSSRNTLLLLRCLEHSYRTALEFDMRPGLKFLIQKVAVADVASNLYKQAGISMLLLNHSLLEICMHQENISVNTTHLLLSQHSSFSSEPQQIHASSDTPPKHYKDALMRVSKEPLYISAIQSTEPCQKVMSVFMQHLKASFDDMCSAYVDMFLDKEGPSRADEMSKQVLVFLLAEPEELPTLKRDKPLVDLLSDKLRRLGSSSEAPNTIIGSLDTQAVPIQGSDDDDDDDDFDAASTTTTGTYRSCFEDPHYGSVTSLEDKVYKVATDSTIKGLVSEYKKRKQQHTMPQFIKAARSRPKPVRRERIPSTDPVDQKIEHQQKASITKDSDAALASWTEMIVSVFGVIQQMPEHPFRSLLPAIFPCTTQLACYASDPKLRHALAIWLHRVGQLYGITTQEQIPMSPNPAS